MGSGIYKAIADAMGEIGAIVKGKKNKEQGFMYRGIDDVMNSLSPILAKNRIFIYPEVTESQRSERATQRGGTLLYSILTVRFHFAHEDGSELCCTVIGEGMDGGDKASNKAMATAYKYACLQMFCIPTEDVDDPDKTTPPESKPLEKRGEVRPEQADKNAVLSDIAKIMKSADAYGNPHFTEAEKQSERAVKNNAKCIGDLVSQRDRLAAELERREKAVNENIPYGEGR